MSRKTLTVYFTTCDECGSELEYAEKRDPLLFKGKKLCRSCLCRDAAPVDRGARRQSSLALFESEPRPSGTVALNNLLTKRMKEKKLGKNWTYWRGSE